MSALSKVLTILAFWLLYTLALFRWGSDTLCMGCGAEEAAPVPTGIEEVQRYPIDFRWADAQAFSNEGYEAFKEELLSQMGENNLLEITGLYFEGEEAPEGYANMGFASADRVRELLGLPKERTNLKARLMTEREGVRTGYFEAALFEWIETEETVAETVEELPDRVNIRFPYNSTEKDYNPEVEEYLRKLGEQMQDSPNRRIMLTGHADNTGSSEYNMQLGLGRAQGIKQILVGYGFPADQIEVTSKGDTQPVATNDTEEGRHENRRVELRIIE